MSAGPPDMNTVDVMNRCRCPVHNTLYRHPREGGDPGWLPREWTGDRTCGLAMSAITAGPGRSAFFVGRRTWIPASAGMTAFSFRDNGLGLIVYQTTGRDMRRPPLPGMRLDSH